MKIKLVLILLFCFYCIVVNYTSIEGNRYWFWGYAFFSDWRNKYCEYSTNKVVCDFYNNIDTEWYRVTNFKKFIKTGDYALPEEIALKLVEGDTISIGIDRYGLYSISNPIISRNVLTKFGSFLEEGNVFVFNLYLKGDYIFWTLKK